MRAKEFVDRKLYEMATLSHSQLKKYEGDSRRDRTPLFLYKIQNSLPFKVKEKDGTIVDVIFDPAEIVKVDAWLKNLSGSSIKIKVKDSDEYISNTQIIKTGEFGGEESEKRLSQERTAMGSLQSQLEIAKQDKPYIELWVGNKLIKAATVKNTPGTPKSDFEILNENNESVAWISHKAGTPATPKKFGQWSGISKFLDHPEVSDFIDTLRRKFPKGVTKGATAVYRDIKDSDLKLRAVYGTDYGVDNAFGINNVTTVLQGPLQLIPNGNEWNLVGLLEYRNGTSVDGDYEPVFIARYTGDRNDAGLPHTRVTIYPKFGRKIEELIYTEED
jgi:hypothetical protein